MLTLHFTFLDCDQTDRVKLFTSVATETLFSLILNFEKNKHVNFDKNLFTFNEIRNYLIREQVNRINNLTAASSCTAFLFLFTKAVMLTLAFSCAILTSMNWQFSSQVTFTPDLLHDL